MNYFIYDCYGQRVGNPKGYRTFAGASRQEKRLYPMLWDRFDKSLHYNPTNKLVCKIKLEYK